MTEWITDRPPTEADADPDGDVLIRRNPSDFIHLPWRYVAAGAPWRRTGTFPAPAKLNTTVSYPRRFVSISRQIAIAGSVLDAVADDGTAWSLWPGDNQWQPHSPLPAREVPADA